jgi:hypothetical protein
MSTISHGHCALSVCAAAAVLAGCGGSAQMPNLTAPPSYATPHGVRPSSSGAEVLTGTAKIKCRLDRRRHGHGQVITGSASTTDFSVARGKAAGPYPGTFTATGRWKINSMIISSQFIEIWIFSEDFSITSGASTISGTIKEGPTDEGSPYPTCTSFGPETSQYTSNYGSGDASIEIIKLGDFNEALDGL